MLNVKEASTLCELLTEKLRQHPRVVGNLLFNEVLTSIQELESNLKPCAPGDPPRPGNEQYYYRWASPNSLHPAVMGFAELLSSICASEITINLSWAEGQPRFYVERR